MPKDNREEPWLSSGVHDRRSLLVGSTAIAVASALGATASVRVAQAQAQPAASAQRPNILVIWGDGVGLANISAYSFGPMGIRTPNIDGIAREGLMFTFYYAEQSCTAGRASIITGHSGLRTGLTKAGLPGATLGLQAQDITMAEALKPLGHATGQFGKNHLGDRNEFLPTVHGFDEFFGNPYHLNAEEEQEHPDYPKDPAFKVKYGPRGVLKCVATDRDDPTVDPRFGRIGKQTIEDTGPLTKKRMETINDNDKNFNWEGAYRVSAMIRWLGRIRPGQVTNEISSSIDWFPTLLAGSGDPEIKGKLLTGYDAAGKTFMVHLDGYNSCRS